MNRPKLIVGAVLVIAAFLLGFVPQYRTSSNLRRELRAAREEVSSLRAEARVAKLRDLLALAYVEANAKNYGIARQYSTEFFMEAGNVAGETTDESLKSLLSEFAQERDRITAGLAEGKGAAQADIERLVRRLYENTMK